ncbi:cold-shock protein [Aliihoeflea sp. 40Bstr573]|uniref:cold-shock protein n=1 Tax=Aliihoeflea sp. 40Bstr573 TaxID=2696467 RepID=UPI00209408D0|nr:cold-shock protein [Aliihoeflea sp. 40Bstr573]MCO6388424.1 cold shock domain-containing protein [Aliihoeflea sp. 40Bstr573]
MAKHRDRRASHRSEWSDEAPSDFQEPSFFRQRPTASAHSGVNVVVLWFNADKGFGFVQTPDGGKAFLHARQLETAGHSTVTEGTTMKVVVESGDKGPQVATVLEVDSPPTAKVAQRPVPPVNAAVDEADGTVKFYNSDKGFGFIGLANGGKDIFVHASTLSRSGISTLEQGQAVRVTYAQGAKGLEARSVRLK